MDEGELSQILGEQFRLLGHAMKERYGVPAVLKPMVNGGDAVVFMKLRRGRLRLLEYDEIFAVKAENALLHKKVKDKDAEIKALNILLEERKKEEELKDPWLDIDAERIEAGIEVTDSNQITGNTVTFTIPKEKPKKKRTQTKRKKAEVKKQ